MELAAIPSLVRQHAQDASFLFVQRTKEIDGQSFDDTDVGRRDQRLSANIEGLAAAGRTGWEIAREEAATWKNSGEWFALLALALEISKAELVAEAIELALSTSVSGERGLSGAVAWTSPAKLAEHVRRWLASAEPALRRLGIAALSHHRVDAGRTLSSLLDDPDPGVRARAARLAGVTGRIDTMPILHERVKEASGRLWPAWATARMGDKDGAWALLDLAEEQSGERTGEVTLDMAVVALGSEAQGELTRLLGQPGTCLAALSRLGVVGERAILPWLIERMRQPETAEAAGVAFRDLFAIDVNDTGLFVDQPARLGAAFAKLDPAPVPVADRVAEWPGPDPAKPPFISQRLRMLDALKAGVASPKSQLQAWRHRRLHPAWM